MDNGRKERLTEIYAQPTIPEGYMEDSVHTLESYLQFVQQVGPVLPQRVQWGQTAGEKIHQVILGYCEDAAKKG